MTKQEAATIIKNDDQFAWYTLEQAKRVNPEAAKEMKTDDSAVVALLKKQGVPQDQWHKYGVQA